MCGSGIVPGRCACEKEKATRNARSPLNASARRALSAYLQLRPKAQPGESLFLSDRNGAFSAMIYLFVVGDQIPKQAGKHGSEGCHDVQQDRTP
jgi:hypothetical protein